MSSSFGHSTVVPTITGTAYVTAEVRLKFDERDPFRWGIRNP